MKRILGFLKNRWVITIVGLLALSILVWFVGPLVAIAGTVPLAGEVPRLIAILIVVVAWGLNNLRIQMQVDKANSQMVSGMAEPLLDVGGVDTAVDHSAEEIGVLKERFDEALQVLKKTARKSGSAGIYDLPWYIIIGPPGSGKTTALVNSGLKFPLAEHFGKEALRGVGGTRNCDWWFTEEAVLIDTAGRYTTQDSHAEVDSAAWEGFLSLLKKHRKRRPINGALVAVSLSDLMLQSEAERAQHVRAIKQRLNELNKYLGIRFPVYVLFTKCDLIAGFMEFFDDLGVDERGQVWGITLPMEKDGEEGQSVRRLIDGLGALMERISQRVLWRMYQERDPQRRARIFTFPQQLVSLQKVGGEFLAEIFATSRFEEPLLLRGAYFTSGTQVGTPIDRVMGALASTFGVSQQMLPAHGGQGRSYFLTRLLKEVVFEEMDLAGANRKLEIQRRWLQRAAYTGAIAVTALAVLAWTTSFTRNEVYVHRFKDRFEEFQELRRAAPTATDDFKSILEPLGALRQANAVYADFDDGVPLLMGMGLYQGDSLTEAGKEAYRRELESTLLPAISNQLEGHLRTGGGDPDFLYEVLKTYLMLGDRQHLDSEQLRLWMGLEWRNRFSTEPEKQGQLQNHLAAMLELGFDPAELDETVIKRARLSLNQVPLSQLLYGRMKRDYAAADKHPFRLSDATGPNGKKVFRRLSGEALESGIPGLFTYEGYHDYFRKQVKNIAQQSSAENWILDPDKGELTEPEIDQLQKEMRQLYFADYIRAWNKLLADIGIVEFRDMRHAVEVLDLVSGPLSPMRSLLQLVAYNTTLEQSGGLLAKAADQVNKVGATENRLARLLKSVSASETLPKPDRPAEVVDKQFERLDALVQAQQGGLAPIDQLLDLLSQLYGQLESMSVGLGTDALSVAAGAGGGDIMRRVQVEGARQPEPVKTWLQQIASSSRGVTMGGARSQVNREWKSTVAPVCQQALVGRYPVYKDSSKEMTLADFGKLFAPGGLIDGFFKNNLQAFVDQSRGTWRWKPVGNATLGLSNAALRQFQRAALIRDTFFQAGGKTPSVSFALKPVYLDANVKSFRLDLEGQQFRYRHGPTRVQQAQWPNPGGTGQVRIQFEDDSGARLSSTIDGPWAWFRILDQARLESTSADRFIATFVKSGRKSSWEIRADSVVNPFMMIQLQQFRCTGNL